MAVSNGEFFLGSRVAEKFVRYSGRIVFVGMEIVAFRDSSIWIGLAGLAPLAATTFAARRFASDSDEILQNEFFE